MTIQSAPDEIRPISHQSTNDKVFSLVLPHLRAGARVIDVGAGEGYFSKMVGDRVASELGRTPESALAACDLLPDFFRYSGVRCDPINPDSSPVKAAKMIDRLGVPSRAIRDANCSIATVPDALSSAPL